MDPGQMMIVLIVLIVVAGSIARAHFLRGGRSAAPTDEPEAARLRAEMTDLKARLQVLERVITDDRKSAELDREIERLRDR